MNIRKLGFDRAVLDGKIVKEDDASLTMGAIIASEMIQKYPDGRAFKPADELEKAAWTADGRWVTIMQHPETGLIAKRSDIKGRVTKPEFCKDLMDVKTKRPCRKGIKADLTWDKSKVPAEILDQVKSGALRDVSIGFTYEEDKTPGEFEGQGYDYVQRNIFIDHVAAPVPVGRCPSPMCGIGIDSILDKTRIAGDPYATISELPEAVKALPEEAQKIFLAVVNSALKQYEGNEEKAFATAWAAVKKKWEKNSEGKWVARSDASTQADMSLSEISSKIESLRNDRDKLWVVLRKKWEAQSKEQQADPEVTDLNRKIDDLDNEIRAWGEAKVQAIIKSASGDCVICVEVEKIGLLEASKRLAVAYGEDVLKVLKGEEVKPPQTDKGKKLDEKPVVQETDAIVEVSRAEKLRRLLKSQ